jgi:hypothetical protein
VDGKRWRKSEALEGLAFFEFNAAGVGPVFGAGDEVEDAVAGLVAGEELVVGGLEADGGGIAGDLEVGAEVGFDDDLDLTGGEGAAGIGGGDADDLGAVEGVEFDEEEEPGFFELIKGLGGIGLVGGSVAIGALLEGLEKAGLGGAGEEEEEKGKHGFHGKRVRCSGWVLQGKRRAGVARLFSWWGMMERIS